MHSKWTSRKFWATVITAISGIVTVFVGVVAADKFAVIAGAALTVAVVLGYIKVEGDIDKANLPK